LANRLPGLSDGPAAAPEHADGRVTISCLVSDLEFCWRLRPDGNITQLEVSVEIPEREAHRLDTQHTVIAQSIERLATRAVSQ
jgi:hypothetical protein